jgi:hypothetical protein
MPCCVDELFQKFNYNPNETPGWNWYCLVYVEWLPRATHLAINPGLVWWFSPGGTLVDGHPGTKRLICLPCLRVLPVQPYDNMGSVLIEYDVRVQP